MELQSSFAIVPAEATSGREPAVLDPMGSPFKVVVDPIMRHRLRKALFDLIDHHDTSLAQYVTDGRLALESYKEYIELFARSLRETMESREGVAYLLKATGIQTTPESVNLHPDWRWK